VNRPHVTWSSLRERWLDVLGILSIALFLGVSFLVIGYVQLTLHRLGLIRVQAEVSCGDGIDCTQLPRAGNGVVYVGGGFALAGIIAVFVCAWRTRTRST
jgi:hypothetical protein